MATYPDIYAGPPAGYTSTKSPKRYVAIHNTSNDASAEAEASYARRRTDSVSSHYYVDGDSLLQSLDTNLGAWHAASPTGNTYAIAYEITGVNSWTRATWLKSVAWDLLARQIARDCKVHGITPQWLTIAQMRDGKTTGLVTHDLMRQAWGGTDHTDPGPNFPMDHLLTLVRAEMEDKMTPAQLKLLNDMAWQIRNVPQPDGKRGMLTGAVSMWGAEVRSLKTAVAEVAAAGGVPDEQVTAILARAEAVARAEVADALHALADAAGPDPTP